MFLAGYLYHSKKLLLTDDLDAELLGLVFLASSISTDDEEVQVLTHRTQGAAVVRDEGLKELW